MSSHPPRPTFRRPVAALAALLLTAVLTGCGFEPSAPHSTPAPPAGGNGPGVPTLGPVSSVPDLHVPGRLQVVAGTADRFIIAGDQTPGRYSADNGRSWQELPAEMVVRADLQRGGGPSFGSYIGYQGTFAGLVPAEEGSGYRGLQRWDPDTGQLTFYPFDLPAMVPGGEAEPLYPVDYVGTTMVLSDGRILRFGDGRVEQLTPNFAATPRLDGLRTALTKDGATAVRLGYSTTGNYGYLNIAPTTGGAAGKAYRIPGLLAMDVSAFTVHYLVGTGTTLRACRANADTPRNATCTKLADGDYRRSRYDARLTTSIGATQAYLVRRSGGGTRQWLVREGRASAVGAPGQRWQWLPLRDSGQPMALVTDRAGVTMAAEVNRNGTPSPLFSAPAVAAHALDGILATGRITYQQDAFSNPAGVRRSVWTRMLGANGLGSAQPLTDRRVVAVRASAARTVAQRGRPGPRGTTRIDCYDGGKRTGSFPAGRGSWLRTLNGPYALVGDRVVRVDGKRYDSGPVLALFGSQVVEASGAEDSASRRFQIRDLERPDAEPVPLELPQPEGRVYRDDGWLAWKDWVVAGYREGGGYDQLIYDRRTGAGITVTGDDEVTALGDGWAAVTTATTTEIRVLDGSGTLPLTQAGRGAVSTDGGRTVAWTDESGVRVAELSGLPVSAPRLLGVIAPPTFAGGALWRPQFDLTQAVRAGSIEIRRTDGTLVRTLPTRASAQGSIRGPAWDGTDTSGKRVPPGRYGWTLVVEGADGSGAATAVDGSGPATGTVTVTAAG